MNKFVKKSDDDISDVTFNYKVKFDNINTLINQNISEIDDMKSQITILTKNYDLLVKENELLKRELEMGTRKKSFRAPIERKEAPVKKVQIQEVPKPNFYGLM